MRQALAALAEAEAEERQRAEEVTIARQRRQLRFPVLVT